MSIRQPLAVFCCMGMAVALLWSKALLAIIPGFMAFVALTDITVAPFSIRWTGRWPAIRESIWRRPAIWVFSLFFLLYLASIAYAGNVKEWWALTHMKLPFLVLALSFGLFEPFNRKQYMIVMLALIVMSAWSSIWVQAAYFGDYALFNRSLGYGAALPVPTHHIRYSIIIASCMVVSLWFAIEDIRYRYAWERGVYAFLAAYFFYFLHLLSVRSGLALGYAGIVILVLAYMRHIHRWKQLAVLAVIALAPLAAYKWMPGFQQKVHYVLYDLKKYREDPTLTYSDAERWRSFDAGMAVANKHPFFGTGTGRFRAEMAAAYKERFGLDTWFRPHNQWMNVFVLFGLFGLLVFSFIILYPMSKPWFWRPPVFAALYIMQLLSMVIEHTLETTVGTAMFLLVTLLGLSHQYYLQEKDGADGQAPAA
jgi:O-antigen ligase